jgi:hypothetical protein
MSKPPLQKAEDWQAPVVKQSEEKPVTKEILAEAIASIGKAADQLLRSGMNERAIVVLIHDLLNAKVGKNDIRLVLRSLPELRRTYCR